MDDMHSSNVNDDAKSKNAGYNSADFELLDGSFPSEKTAGDGNCAFNAFILAFSNEEVLNYLEKQSQEDDNFCGHFLESAAVALGVKDATWPSVKQAILSLRKANKRELQIKLAPIMREIALDGVETDQDYFSHLKDLLLPSAFRDFVSKEFAIPLANDQTPDDILRRHEFIQKNFLDIFFEATHKLEINQKRVILDRKEFESLKNKIAEISAFIRTLDLHDPKREEQTQALTELRNTLKKKLKEKFQNITNKDFSKNFEKEADHLLADWWVNTGYQDFCQAMRASGIEAGDLELKRLARAFCLNLNVISLAKKEPYLQPIHDNKPEFIITDLTADVDQLDGILHELVDHQIIEHTFESNNFCFPSNFSIEDIEKRSAQAIEEKELRNWYANDRIPDDCDPKIIEELQIRNILDNQLKFSIKDVDRAVQLTSAITAKTRAALTEFLKHHHNFLKTGPELLLINKGASHWSNSAYQYQKAIFEDYQKEQQKKSATPNSNPSVTKQSLFVPKNNPEKSKAAANSQPPKSIVEVSDTSHTEPVVDSTTTTTKPIIEPKPLPKDFQEFLNSDAYKKAKAIIAKNHWTIEELNNTYRRVSKDKNPADATEGKLTFDIYVNKLITHQDEPETFKMMLTTFRKMHGMEKLPKITTHSDTAKAEWVKALKAIYDDKPEVDWEKQVTAPTTKSAPGIPVEENSEPVTKHTF